MPFPLNQMRKRDSIGSTPLALLGAAYAVPLKLNIAASGGRPTLTSAPVTLTPLKNLRLSSCILASSLCGRWGANKPLLIIFQTSQEFRRAYQADQQVFEM